MLNNVGFSLAVEKMLGITVPERCQYYRVVLGELARICDHLICSGAMAMELGAFTPFLYFAARPRGHLGHLRGGDGRARHAQLRPRGRHGEAADVRLQGAWSAPASPASSAW